jgi:hypothetical protein
MEDVNSDPHKDRDKAMEDNLRKALSADRPGDAFEAAIEIEETEIRTVTVFNIPTWLVYHIGHSNHAQPQQPIVGGRQW